MSILAPGHLCMTGDICSKIKCWIKTCRVQVKNNVGLYRLNVWQLMACLKTSTVETVAMSCGREFQSVVADGKKKCLNTSILGWMVTSL